VLGRSFGGRWGGAIDLVADSFQYKWIKKLARNRLNGLTCPCFKGLIDQRKFWEVVCNERNLKVKNPSTGNAEVNDLKLLSEIDAEGS
jgi:hypothetical protein